MRPSTVYPIVDIHTHIYTPSYLSLLSSRSTPPQLLNLPPSSPSHSPPPPRLIILPSDAPSSNPHVPPSQLGRPIGPEYSSVTHILSFMNTHRISISILSLANPWLDFLPSDEAASWARRINTELSTISAESAGRIYAFGVLPLTAPLPAILDEINYLTTDTHCRDSIKGIILGTTGLGSGLDDPALSPLFSALLGTSSSSSSSPTPSPLPLFIHPHYGLPSHLFGGGSALQSSGHVLPLSLGFPLETTIAFTRMWLAGVFDRFPELQVMLAHAGGAMTALAGRVQSCVEHERGYYASSGAGAGVAGEDGEGGEGDDGGQGAHHGERIGGPKRSLEEVLRGNVYLDAVSYSAVGTRAAVEVVGRERVLFGTDHPFFPPLGEQHEEWMSVRTNVEAVRGALGEDEEGIKGVMGGNAVRIFGLDDEAWKGKGDVDRGEEVNTHDESSRP